MLSLMLKALMYAFVALGKSHNPPEPQFAHLLNEAILKQLCKMCVWVYEQCEHVFTNVKVSQLWCKYDKI